MQRRAVLHIGPMKTGSSSIQSWLVRRAQDLLTKGYFVPRAMGGNMSRLAPIAEACVLNLAPTAIDSQRLNGFKAELDALGPDVHTILISAEMLGQQLRNPEQLQFVKNLLDPYVTDYAVFAYLRRQDELSLSRYSTALRLGQRRSRPLSNAFDFEQMLEAWAGTFGAETVHPRLYERSSLIAGDVVQDFAAAASIPYDDANERAIQMNPSLRPEAQAFLAAFAARVRDNGFERPFETITGHSAVNRLLSTKYAGPGLLPSRDEVMAFLAKVADSNERVRLRWFPERATLFSEDFSRYSEDAAVPASPEAILDVAMEVLTHLVTAETALEPRAKVEVQLARRSLDEQLRKERRAAKGAGRRKLRRPSLTTE